MTPPDDVSTRLSEIRERVEAATEGAEKKAFREGYRYGYDCGMGCATYTGYCDAPDLEEAWEESDARSSARSDVPYLLSLVEEVVDLAAGWRRAYPPEVFPEPPERPADGAKLVWIDPETGEQLSEPFAIDRASAAMGRFMAERLFTALRDAAQEGAE